MPLGCEEFFLCSIGGKQQQRIINHRFRKSWPIVELSWVNVFTGACVKFLNIALLRVLFGIIVQLLRRSAGSHPLTHKFITERVPGLRAEARSPQSEERVNQNHHLHLHTHTIIPTLWLSTSLPFSCSLRLFVSSHVQRHVRLMNYTAVYYPSVDHTGCLSPTLWLRMYGMSHLKKRKLKHRQHKVQHSSCTQM